MLVLFEGNDGCGKSSTAKIFAEWLEKEFPEIPVQQLYEPGSGSLGPTLREILKHSSQPIVPAAELFLFLASRAQLMKQGIISAIQAGEIVVLDRSTLSSLAYQVAGCGLDPTLALPAIELATCGVVPDITFVLKASPEVVRMRNPNKQPDRIEARGEEFHARVSRGFECFADLLKHRAERPWKIHAIDTDELTRPQVLERVKHHFEKDGLVEKLRSRLRAAHGDIG